MGLVAVRQPLLHCMKRVHCVHRRCSPSLAPLRQLATEALDGEEFAAIQRIQELLYASPRVTLLTGAGMSTDSGIPDYRSPGRPPYRPLQHHEFMTSEYTRKRYWTRSMIGKIPQHTNQDIWPAL